MGCADRLQGEKALRDEGYCLGQAMPTPDALNREPEAATTVSLEA